jgi:hypothetical protein
MMFHAPVGAENDKTIIAALPTVSVSADPEIKQASDYIKQSQDAQQRQLRRKDIKPTSQEKFARLHRDSDHVLILGGSESIPM